VGAISASPPFELPRSRKYIFRIREIKLYFFYLKEGEADTWDSGNEKLLKYFVNELN
jgi:hypothetical protein